MKTRRILAASTAALLSMASVAVVASAAEDLADIADDEEFTDLSAGVAARIDPNDVKKLSAYTIDADAGTTLDKDDLFDLNTAKTGIVAKSGGAFENLSSKVIKNIVKAAGLNVNPGSDPDDVSDNAVADGDDVLAAQVFNITIGDADNDAGMVLDEDIKLKANVVVKITSSVKGNVYHLSSDGKTMEKVNAARHRATDGSSNYYYIFETNSFSPFVVMNADVSGLGGAGTAVTIDGEELVNSDTSSEASNADNNGNNSETGIALAIAPVVLAAGAVAVVAIKKKH